MEVLSLSKNFTIDDLKYGYLVELRNGRYALYMPSKNGDVFDFGNSYLVVEHYQNDLKFYRNKNSYYDVVKVFSFSDLRTIQLTTYNRELLWERK